MSSHNYYCLILFLSVHAGVLCEDYFAGLGLLKLSEGVMNRLEDEFSSAIHTDPKNVSDVPENCRVLLDNFAHAVSNFTNCMIINARPVTLCTVCYRFLLNMRAAYQTILDAKDSDCKHHLLNRDRLMVVQSIYEYLNKVWSNGRCDNCFYIEHINGTVKYSICNDTLKFYEKWNDVMDCLNSTKNDLAQKVHKNESAVCLICHPVYLELNRYYESMNTKYSNLLCMDVMDLMNITRHQWTKTYHCVQYDFSGLPVFILSAVMALIPVLFYGGNRIFSHVRDTRLLQQKRLSFVHSSFTSSVATQRERFY